LKKKMNKWAVLFSLLLLVMVVVPLPSSHATTDYTGGLLDGLTGHYGSNENDSDPVSTAPNDNNESTSLYDDDIPNKTWTVTFSSVQTISYYRVLTDYTTHSGTYFRFFDSSGTVIYAGRPTLTTQDGSLQPLGSTITGVKKVSVEYYSGNYTLYEVNFYSSTPTPTPTSTPTPTPTPTSTPTPTPSPSPTPTPTPSTNRVTLTITLTNGALQEYDLSMTEFNAFAAWYDAKATGTGLARYTLDDSSAKGPYISKKTSVIFGNILTFSYDEYIPTS